MSDSPELPVSLARDLDIEKPQERWLITDLWGRSAVGILGGAPKVGKSWLGLDLAVSIASGTPALGKFPVELSGPVLIYLAEDAVPQVRCRIESLCQHRQLDIRHLPLHVITAVRLRLDGHSDQERLRATVARIRPHLVLLDPLVRLHSIDENSSAEVSGFLSYFRELQRSFDTAVILVHHASKKSRAQPGQALRGSSDLHAFGDSNAYLASRGDHITLTLEHRAAKPPAPLNLELVSESDGSGTHLEICGPAAPSAQSTPVLPLEDRVFNALNEKPRTRTALRQYLGVNNHRLGVALDDLFRNQRARKTKEGWVRLT